MEKFFKIFILVMAVVLIAFLIISVTSTKRESYAAQKKVQEAFSQASKQSSIQERLNEIAEDIGRIGKESSEKSEQALKKLEEANEALKEGNDKEAERILNEIKDLCGP